MNAPIALRTLRLAALALCLAVLAGCTEGSPHVAAVVTIPPGGVFRQTRAPVDWEMTGATSKSATYRCKPLVCGKAATVYFQNLPPLARHPDPQALEHFALVDTPKRFLADDASQSILSNGKRHQVLLHSEAGKALDRPAILIDAKKTIDGKQEYIAFARIFAGPILLSVASTADTLEHAHANLDLLLAHTTLTDGPGV